MTKASANGTIIPEHTMSLHPYFGFDVQRNVTARVGSFATFLQCKVEQLGDKSVSILIVFLFFSASVDFLVSDSFQTVTRSCVCLFFGALCYFQHIRLFSWILHFNLSERVQPTCHIYIDSYFLYNFSFHHRIFNIQMHSKLMKFKVAHFSSNSYTWFRDIS